MSWPIVAIADLTESSQYGTSAKAGAAGAFPILRMGNITYDGRIDLGDLKYIDLPSREVEKYTVRAGDILFNRTNSPDLVGKTAVFRGTEPHAFAGYLVRLRTNSRADPHYVSAYLNSPRGKATLRSMAKSIVGMANINARELGTIRIPLPLLDEQRRIAAILEQANELRLKRLSTIVQTGKLWQSLFVDTFGDPAVNERCWPHSKLGELSTIFSDGPFGSNLKSEHYVPKGARVVRLQNIGVGKFIDEDRAYISNSHFQRLIKHSCHPRDVIIGTLGDPNLRACLLPDALGAALNKADCVQMRCDESRALPEYIEALLNHPSTERMASSKIQGQTRLRISMGRLRELEVPVPPLCLQQDFANRVAQVRLTQFKCAAHLDHLNELFASLQHRAFNGELTAKAVQRELAQAG